MEDARAGLRGQPGHLVGRPQTAILDEFVDKDDGDGYGYGYGYINEGI